MYWPGGALSTCIPINELILALSGGPSLERVRGFWPGVRWESDFWGRFSRCLIRDCIETSPITIALIRSFVNSLLSGLSINAFKSAEKISQLLQLKLARFWTWSLWRKSIIFTYVLVWIWASVGNISYSNIHHILILLVRKLDEDRNLSLN